MTARAVLAAPLFIAGVACAEPVVVDRGDSGAALAPQLEKAGIPTVRRGDEVAVDRQDVARAVSIARGVVPHDARVRPLVPSLADERERDLRDRERRLEATLRTLPGVLGARVHIDAPAPTGPLDPPPSRPRAVVVLTGAQEPIEASARAIVATAVAGLEPERVRIERLPFEPARAATLGQVGPFRVALESVAPLRATLAAVLVVSSALAGALMVLVRRRREAA